MSYALVSWQPPPDSDGAQIDEQILETIRQDFPNREPVLLLDRLLLCPSDRRGVGYSRVKRMLRPVIQAHPGIEVMIIMPDPGAPVGGWVDPARGNFQTARPIMNMPNTDDYPEIL
jgi:hypothetical protein